MYIFRHQIIISDQIELTPKALKSHQQRSSILISPFYYQFSIYSKIAYVIIHQ